MIKTVKIYYVFLLVALFINTGLQAQPNERVDAKEIALPTSMGDTIKLSSLKGKIVLLDFWASWCGPCRSSNKNLLKLYEKYKDKGFEIFGVSLDESKKDWEKAMKKDKISWIQVNDDGGRYSKTSLDWNIYELPTSYLIDRNGKLLALNLEGKELEHFLKDLL